MILGEEGSKISQIAEVPLVTSRGECAEPIIGGLNRCQSQKRYNKNGKELHFALSPSFRQREQDKRVSFYIKAKLALIEVELTIVRLMVEIPSEKGRKKKIGVKWQPTPRATLFRNVFPSKDLIGVIEMKRTSEDGNLLRTSAKWNDGSRQRKRAGRTKKNKAKKRQFESHCSFWVLPSNRSHRLIHLCFDNRARLPRPVSMILSRWIDLFRFCILFFYALIH